MNNTIYRDTLTLIYHEEIDVVKIGTSLDKVTNEVSKRTHALFLSVYPTFRTDSQDWSRIKKLSSADYYKFSVRFQIIP